MAGNASSSPGSITLEQVIALNEEIAALVRAGVPLEPALAELGRDLPGRMGKIAAMLSARSTQGEPLVNVLCDPAMPLPPVYRAVVAAGLKAGRLPAALEALASALRRLIQTRRSIASAALYPLIVLILAWGLLAFFSRQIAPAVFTMFNLVPVDSLAAMERGMLGRLAYYGQWALYWGPLVPLLIATGAVFWWYSSSRAGALEPYRVGRLMGWIPWVRQTLRWSRAATFVEILTILIENQVPLHEAIVLAGEASGDRQMMDAARRLAKVMADGQPAGAIAGTRGEGVGRQDAPGRDSAGNLPPLLAWVISAADRQGALLPALRHVGQTYRQRAEHQAELARIFLPVLLTIFVGGSVTLAYAVMVFAPYASLLRMLGVPGAG